MVKLLLLLFFVMLVMAGTAFLRLRLHGEKITREAVWHMLVSAKYLRLSVALLAVLFACVFTWIYQKEQDAEASVQITMNYAEASKGQNANGVRYNMWEIISDEVLERVIEKGALEGVTVSQLSNCLEVYPLVEGGSESEEDYHIATEFGVTFKKDRYTKDLDPHEVVRLLGYAYKDYYIDTYADNFRVLNISIDPEEDFKDMEYMDIKQKLELLTDEITNYMYALSEENSTFAASNGESFLSIAGKCEDLKSVMIQNSLEAYLLQNGISKDAESYADRLRYDNEKSGFDYQRAEASFDVRNQAVAKYAEEMTRIVLVPTWDENGKYYMGRTKVGIDELSVEAETYSQSAAGYLEAMETNNSIIQSMEASERSGTDAYAEEMIRTISETITDLASSARMTAQEYSETRMNECVSVTVVQAAFSQYAVLCGGFTIMFYVAGCILLPRKKRKADR